MALNFAQLAVQKVKKVASDLGKTIVNQTPFANPTANNGNNFWSGKIAQGMAGVQTRMQQANIVPQITPFNPQKLSGQIGNAITNIPGGMINTIYGKGLIQPTMDITNMAKQTIQKQPLTNYSDLLSSQARLGYNVMGINRTPQQVLGNVAGSINPVLTAYIPGGGKRLLEGGVKEVTKKGFIQAVKEGAASGAKYGAGFGLLGGMEENRDTKGVTNYLKNIGISTGAGTLFGGLLGGGLAALGGLKGLITRKPEVEVQLRDKQGRWAEGDTPVKPKDMPKPQWEFQIKFNKKYKRNPYTPVTPTDLEASINYEANKRIGLQARDVNLDKNPLNTQPKGVGGVDELNVLKQQRAVLNRKLDLTTSQEGINKLSTELNQVEGQIAKIEGNVAPVVPKSEAFGFKLKDRSGNEYLPVKDLGKGSAGERNYLVIDKAGNETVRSTSRPNYAIDPLGLSVVRDHTQNSKSLDEVVKSFQSQPVVPVPPTQPKGVGGVEGGVTPKTVRVWKKSRFSEGGGYADVPVIREEKNITLYQGGNAGDGRQFWTPDKKYAEQFGKVTEKTGSFYQVDNGNRMTNVYVEAKPQPEGGVGVKSKQSLIQSQPQLQTEPIPKANQPHSVPPTVASSQPIIDPVQKIIMALKEAKPLEKQQGAIYSKIRSRQAGAIAGIGKNVPGEAGFHAQLGQLKGEMPKVQFESIRKQITQPDIDSLFNTIEQSNISTFEKITAKSGLAKILGAEGGSVPVQSELKLLNEIFPPEFVQAVLDQRSTMQKLFSVGAEALNLPRAMMATADLSAPLRQGVFLIGRPKQFLPALRDQFKYFFSEKAYKRAMDSYKADPLYKTMRETKLALTDTGPLMLGREEAFMSNLAEKIPGFGSLAKASNRAYSGFLNKLRFDTFKDMYKSAKTLGLDMDTVAPDIAKFVNAATGRGGLGALERAAPVLNGAFFSPRLMASRLNLLNPKFYMDLNPFVRKEAIKSLLTFAGTGMTVLTLAKLAGAEVGVDPTSSDFGKIKVGNTRLDIWGGFQQYFRAAGQLITGKYTSSTTGKEYTLGEGYKPLTRLGIVGRVIESKEAPVVSFVSQLLTGQNSLGGKLDVPVEVLNRFIPMVASGFYDLYKEGGLKEVGLGLPSIFGVGVQTYGKQIPTQETTPAGKPTIKLNPVPGLAEDIVGKIRGTQPSNIPQEKWAGIVGAKTDEQQLKILKDKVKQNPQSTDKGILNQNNIFVTPEGDFVDTNKVSSMPSSTPYEQALKEGEAYKIADNILKLSVEDQAKAFNSIGVSPEDAVYFNTASQADRLKSLYVDEQIGKLDTSNRANLINYLISQRKEVNAKMVLSNTKIGELADAGTISDAEATMLKNLKIVNGKPVTKLTGRGKKVTLKKVSALPAPAKIKVRSMASLLKTKKLKVKRYKFKRSFA